MSGCTIPIVSTVTKGIDRGSPSAGLCYHADDMKKALVWTLVVLVVAAVVASAMFVDRLAVGYMTGQRRVVGEGFWGESIPDGGPVPGYAFLGFTRTSEEPPGFTILRPWEMALEMGLERGDVVTSVAGETFTSSQDLMSHLVSNYTAGDSVSLTAVRDGEAPRELSMTLRAFVRHPGDLELPYEDVEFESDNGMTLRGWFIPPPERSDGRIGIFVHGANSSRFQALENGAKFWHNRGYGVLAMDLSGRGTSDGDYVTYSVNERRDVAAMVRWARERAGGPERVVVFGTSNGASSSIYAASELSDLPALVLDAPYADLRSAATAMLTSRGGHAMLIQPLFLAVRLRTGIDLGSVRPSEVITDVSAPILFVHGDADRQVPIEHSRRLHEARRGAGLPSELWELPGGEHGFDNYPPEGIFWNRILDFFDEALGGPPPEWDLSSPSGD